MRDQRAEVGPSLPHRHMQPFPSAVNQLGSPRLDAMTDARVWSVTSTVPTRDQALELARAAVKEKLAAGAEVTGPATSVFWHLGELGEGEEWRVTLRTSLSARDALATRLAELHPWDSPEVSASPVVWCTETYAAWVERTTAEPESAV